MTRSVAVGRAIALFLLASLPLAEPGTAAAQQNPHSDISSDEDVVFFPGVAVETRSGSFEAHIRGWIFEPLKSKTEIESIAAAFER